MISYEIQFKVFIIICKLDPEGESPPLFQNLRFKDIYSQEGDPLHVWSMSFLTITKERVY